jgi:hypothetical protein
MRKSNPRISLKGFVSAFGLHRIIKILKFLGKGRGRRGLFVKKGFFLKYFLLFPFKSLEIKSIMLYNKTNAKKISFVTRTRI